MNHTNPITADAELLNDSELARPGSGLLRKAVLERLRKLEHGQVTILEHGERMVFGQATDKCPVSVTLRVLDGGLYRDIALGGDIAAAEAYMEGKWTVDDLTGLVRIFAANPTVLSQIEYGIARVINPLLRLAHWLRRNSRAQSRRNIGAHYDLGDDLFELFLDPTMSYSSAVYPAPDSSLDEAAVHKLELVCRKLQLGPEDHLLEIGTGWGGLAVYAAQNFGCRVTTTTISENQYQLARQRVAAAGLEDRITLLKEDYRDLSGQYDKLVPLSFCLSQARQECFGAVEVLWPSSQFRL